MSDSSRRVDATEPERTLEEESRFVKRPRARRVREFANLVNGVGEVVEWETKLVRRGGVHPFEVCQEELPHTEVLRWGQGVRLEHEAAGDVLTGSYFARIASASFRETTPAVSISFIASR